MEMILESHEEETTEHTHLLVEQTVSKDGWLAMALCGFQLLRPSGTALQSFTGWQSRVTCPECLN